MKIQSIKKVGSNKYYLIFENNEKITTYDEVILKYNLLYKHEVDSSFVKTIIQETSYYDIYLKIVKYISIRLRSEFEIKKYMEKFHLAEVQKQQLLEKLKQAGLLNDKNFTIAFISDKLHLSTMGPLKIKKELLKHQINSKIIEEEISKIDEEEVFDKLYKLVVKKIEANKKYSSYILKQKLLLYFKDLGYETTMIDQCFYEIGNKEEDILSKEAEKLYKKLSRKYQGTELTRKVKEKLYQKGFDINEITSYLNKKESI